MLDGFFYPGEAAPRGILEMPVSDGIRAALEELAPMVATGLKNDHRDGLWDCGYVVSSWLNVLGSAGIAVRRVGGVGEHVDTVPATAPEQRSGYLTSDDGLVLHWWLMIEASGAMFDPTAHQFDGRGGVALERYVVEGQPLLEWRRDWPACAASFAVGSPARSSAASALRARLRIR